MAEKVYSFKDCDGAFELPGPPSNRVVSAVLESLTVETTGKGSVRLVWRNTFGEGGQLVFTPDMAVELSSMLLNLQIAAREEVQ
jgi:hypothetical protein